MGIVTGLIVSAAIGAGATIYAADQADDARKEAERKAAEAKKKADERELNRRPEGESATLMPGSGEDDRGGSYNDFLTPKRTVNSLGGTGSGSGISSNGKTGLGFSV